MNRLLPGLLLAACALPEAALAATPLGALRYTPDISLNLSGTLVTPGSVASDDLAGGIALALPALPGQVAAYHYLPASGTHWLVFDTTVALPDGLTATPRDVVSFDGSSYGLLLDGAAAGLPSGTAIDALASTDGSDLLISLDTTAIVGGLTVAPADVIRRAGGAWSSHFSAAGAGVPAGVNLSGLDYLPGNGHLLLSFDISGSVGGVSFNDEDILEFTAPATWELAYQGAAHDAGWGAAGLAAFSAQAAATGPAGLLQFSAPSYSVGEAGVTATITVTRSGGSTGAVSVQYATANGSASQPGDYASASGSLGWASGDLSSKTFSVPVVDDAVVEGDETVLLTLSNPTGGAVLGTASATLTVIDNDGPGGAGALLAAVPASVVFPAQPLGAPLPYQNVVLTNIGNASLTLGTLNLVGAGAGSFTLSGACAGVTLAPQASCTVTVGLLTGTPGSVAATLSVTSNAAASPQLDVPLSGTVLAGGAGGLAAVPLFGPLWAGLTVLVMGLVSRRRRPG